MDAPDTRSLPENAYRTLAHSQNRKSERSEDWLRSPFDGHEATAQTVSAPGFLAGKHTKEA